MKMFHYRWQYRVALTVAVSGHVWLCRLQRMEDPATPPRMKRTTPILPSCSPFRPTRWPMCRCSRLSPASLTRTLRLTGAVAYNSFHTTPVITQVSGPVSRDCGRSRPEGRAGAAHVVRGKSRLLPAPHKLSESQRRLCAGAKGLCASEGLVSSTMPLPNRIWSRLSRPRCKPAGTWWRQKPHSRYWESPIRMRW